MRRLLIVESPTKARTISRMLGKDYTVMASMGHVRDLPEHAFGVDIANNFAPSYVDNPKSAKIVKELRSAAKKADEIYLAPDPDREGEAIAWHLAEVLKSVWKKDFHRVTFHEITRSAISKALSEQTFINMNLVDAQQARRVLDRIVGYQVSPLLWSQLEKGISAGRVQSVALRLVVEREREITNFTPDEYWVFSLVFRTVSGAEFAARLFKINGKDFKINNGADAEKALNAILNGSIPAVRTVTTAERRRNAPPPFTTSTLQQSASNAFHYSATTTMRYAQELYEGVELGDGGSVGLITYMRTDSVTIAKEAQLAALDFIRDNYGSEYCPAQPNRFKNKAAAQEAHEAIRPTDINRTPEMMAPYLSPDLLKLYTLIWRRFTASQMAQCVQNLTTVDTGIAGADKNEYTFRATATVPVFPGFTKVYGDEKQKDDSGEAAILGVLRENDNLSIARADKEQKFTEPPPRYTEATLIKELEENGIGRPSTYATILRTIQQRDYVGREQGRLFPTELGFRVCDFLVGHLPELFDVRFTADMENKLDDVEAGTVAWTKMMSDFYQKFAPWLEKAKASDAPPAENVEYLINQLSKVQFDPPAKGRGRSFNNAKFFDSVAEAFRTDGYISRKQYQVLLNLSAKYANQINHSAMPEALAAELQEAAASVAEREEKAAATALSDEAKADYTRLFDAFSKVNWEAPSTSRGRTYDDKKFFTSLKKQALDSSRMMSEKQLAAFAKLAEKYQSEIADYQFVSGMLSVKNEAEESGADESIAKIEAILNTLSQVTQWAEPVKKGRVTYDDWDFYNSLSTQFARSRKLSAKQIAALEKMAAKYSGGMVVETAAAPAPQADLSALFEVMESVTDWAAPEKKGRFTIDDKKFYQSLKSQHDRGKTLSEKQVAALSKLADKYRK